MSIWFFINIIVFIFAIWKITTGYINLPIIFGGLGFILVLYNWTRHAVFSTIRSNISRERKVKLAQFSKKVLPYHKWTGSLALVLILTHFIFITHYYEFTIHSAKMLSGLFAFMILILMVSSGWLRFFKTTYAIRLLHLTLGFCLFISVIIHLIL